ncbi:hypothetical protein PUMCH_004530 [Australozyma saopauloensis]|uniref:Metallo-beta-lactamase domain-containing protein n=1 Tax=Australozyma saopauloensis TaxID=291208 RepID=A0AAX4HF08_9ASCO|nr:hypothetical protein PUMCH_004530 [[Candida] saopauloensis]
MYPEKFLTSIKKISENVVTVSCAFKVLNRLDVGNRMSLINCDGQVVVFSPIKYGDYFQEALKLLGASNIAYIVVVNCEHNVAAKEYAENYPEAKVVCGEGFAPNQKWKPDFVFNKEAGNRLLNDYLLEEHFSFEWPASLEILYLKYLKNKELVLYETESKTLFVGDILLNIGTVGENGFEQYSPATGYPEKHNPFTGWSYPLRFIHPRGFLGRYFNQALANVANPGGEAGIHMIYNKWDFKTIVPCHGNIITEYAKEEFKLTFPKVDFTPWELRD